MHGKQLETSDVVRPHLLELTVPSYVKDVNSLADLKAHASEFDGKIIGIEPQRRHDGPLGTQVLKEYGLEGTYDVVDGSTPAMLCRAGRAYARKQPVVVTLWSPHWAYSDYDLEEAEGSQGRLGQGRRRAHAHRKGFADDHPQVGAWLKDFSMTE